MKRAVLTVVGLALMAAMSGCDDYTPSTDQTQTKQQDTILAEGSVQVGMPAIKNFRERKLLKDVLELRDQEGLTTYTYLFPEVSGKPQFFCTSIGYGLPYATQFTNPQRPARYNETQEHGNIALPQADPNGLFSPASADGTWVLCKQPNGDKVLPVYLEPRVIVSPFKLPE